MLRGGLPVVLVHPVSKLTAAEPKGIKIMLSGDLHAIPIIRSGTFDMGKLWRDKTDLSVFVPAFGKFLHPFQGSFFGPKIGPQDRIAFVT